MQERLRGKKPWAKRPWLAWVEPGERVPRQRVGPSP